MDYWQRLQALKLYSIQRRFERYKIIYVWKIIQGIVTNPGIQINNDRGSRTGLTCKIPKHTKTFREKSFMVTGPRLFNELPKDIKEFQFPNLNEENHHEAVEAFKGKLDKFLTTIPDEPNLSGEYSKRITGINTLGQKTNSHMFLRSFCLLMKPSVLQANQKAV